MDIRVTSTVVEIATGDIARALDFYRLLGFDVPDPDGPHVEVELPGGNRLAFEITEGLEMEMHSDILRCISDLKLLGIKIWLDDFGTGFAGLSWLRLIDFDVVKVDRSFLHDCVSPRGQAMFQDIVGLLRNRGPKILVEGVESEEQMDLLRKLAIDLAQGFHVGRPARVESFRSFFPASRRQKVLGNPL